MYIKIYVEKWSSTQNNSNFSLFIVLFHFTQCISVQTWPSSGDFSFKVAYSSSTAWSFISGYRRDISCKLTCLSNGSSYQLISQLFKFTFWEAVHFRAISPQWMLFEQIFPKNKCFTIQQQLACLYIMDQFQGKVCHH